MFVVVLWPSMLLSILNIGFAFGVSKVSCLRSDLCFSTEELGPIDYTNCIMRGDLRSDLNCEFKLIYSLTFRGDMIFSLRLILLLAYWPTNELTFLIGYKSDLTFEIGSYLDYAVTIMEPVFLVDWVSLSSIIFFVNPGSLPSPGVLTLSSFRYWLYYDLLSFRCY